MAEQFHKGVDGDVGLAVSVAKVWRNPCTSAPRARSASMSARRNARTTRYRRVPRVMRSPSAPTNSGVPVGQAVSPPPGEERRLAVAEMALDHLDQHRFDRDPAVLAALAADLDDRAVGGTAEVTDVDAQQFDRRATRPAAR